MFVNLVKVLLRNVVLKIVISFFILNVEKEVNLCLKVVNIFCRLFVIYIVHFNCVRNF